LRVSHWCRTTRGAQRLGPLLDASQHVARHGVGRVSSAGWQQVYPQGIYDVLARLRRDYGSPRILITENGVPDDVADSGNPMADQARTGFLYEHLRALHKAIGEGSRIRGYCVWSLLDSFEWPAGYSQRWGLVRVDSLARSPKASASWYASAAASNSVPAE
jgi:beta-glucosidase